MKKISLFVTRRIPDEGMKLLKKDKRLSIHVYPEDKIIPRKDLLRGVKDADIVLSILTDRMDREAINAAPHLKMIANYGVGFDNVDVVAAKERGIVVTNAAHPRVSETVADHTVALMLALAHRLVEGDMFARAGKYKGWGPEMMLGADISGKTLGIIGGGAIGEMVAQRLHAGFGMKI